MRLFPPDAILLSVQLTPFVGHIHRFCFLKCINFGVSLALTVGTKTREAIRTNDLISRFSALDVFGFCAGGKYGKNVYLPNNSVSARIATV